jgi:hypothetical protein
MVPVPTVVERTKFLYIDKSVLFMDQARQYYFTVDDKELERCKVMNAGSYLCKQRHPLLSSHLVKSCAVKMLQPRRTIPQSCETRIVQLSHTVRIQLVSNAWLYLAPHPDTVTVLCRDDEPSDVTLTGVSKLHIHAGCKG